MQTKEYPSEDVLAPEEVHLNEKIVDPSFVGW